MLIQSNTLRYDYSGRRRSKPKVRGETFQKFKASGFQPLGASTGPVRRGTDVEYKSAPINSCAVEKNDDTYKQEVSRNYTVAPAYNKGAYQVVSKENVKHIGK